MLGQILQQRQNIFSDTIIQREQNLRNARRRCTLCGKERQRKNDSDSETQIRNNVAVVSNLSTRDVPSPSTALFAVLSFCIMRAPGVRERDSAVRT